MSQFFAVVLRELLIFKKRLFKQLISYTISPLLFLVTFGWGFGDKVDIDGTPYIVYMIPGLIAMNSMRHSFSLSTEINISRFYWKTFDEISSTPIRDVAYTSGEMISGVIKGMIASFIVILLSILFKVFFRINLLFLVSVFLNTSLFSLLGIITAMSVRNHADQAMMNNFIITPMSFLCNTFFPLRTYPIWVRWIINVLPLTHSAKCIRASLLGIEFPIGSLIYLVFFSVLSYIIAVLVIKKSKD